MRSAQAAPAALAAEANVMLAEIRFCSLEDNMKLISTVLLLGFALLAQGALAQRLESGANLIGVAFDQLGWRTLLVPTEDQPGFDAFVLVGDLAADA